MKNIKTQIGTKLKFNYWRWKKTLKKIFWKINFWQNLKPAFAKNNLITWQLRRNTLDSVLRSRNVLNWNSHVPMPFSWFLGVQKVVQNATIKGPSQYTLYHRRLPALYRRSHTYRCPLQRCRKYQTLHCTATRVILDVKFTMSCWQCVVSSALCALCSVNC